MVRIFGALLPALLLVAGPVRAADDVLAGNWKVTVQEEDKPTSLWLLKFEAKDGKVTASLLDSLSNFAGAKLEDVGVTEGVLHFTVKIADQVFAFEGKVPKDAGKTAYGTLLLNGKDIVPVLLEPTSIKDLKDEYEIKKDFVARNPTDPKVFSAILDLLRQAAAKKAKPEEVRAWGDRAFKAADAYGPRWQRDIAQRIASTLVDQEGFASIALEYAHKAERMMETDEKPDVQVPLLMVLAQALRKADKMDEAREVEARIDKLLSVKSEPYPGRKGKADRAVVVELFTTVGNPECVAEEIVLDALGRTYKPSEVVLLEYHLPVRRSPDPLCTPDVKGRLEYYQDDIQELPTRLLNGKLGKLPPIALDATGTRYKDYRGLIDPLLETTAPVKLQVTAVQKGQKLDINAEVADLENPGADMSLRLVLVEERVDYTGTNLLRVHHHVVRDFPGGTRGWALPNKTAKQAVTVDLEELRKKLAKFMDDIVQGRNRPGEKAPVELKNLRVVALVQNDKTRAVLQAVQVEVKVEKE